MKKTLTVRLDTELAADAEALARAEGTSLNETVKQALIEAVYHGPARPARCDADGPLPFASLA